MRISVFGGFVLAFPVISYQLWRFVAPGLYRQEKRAFLPFLIASPVLFLLGCAFAFYVLLPMVYNFFLGFQQFGSAPVTDPSQDVTIQYPRHDQRIPVADHEVHGGLRHLLPASGGADADGDRRAGDPKGLASFRRYALVLMLVVAAFVTPGPDVMSQVILFAAIYPLYEISILLVRFFERKREAELKAQGLWDEEAAAEEP